MNRMMTRRQLFPIPRNWPRHWMKILRRLLPTGLRFLKKFPAEQVLL